MELKVWVEGIQRIVCGVTVNTTCQDVVFALAHATGKVGRFTLIERWRNNERLLAPSENPLKILMKWAEYSNDVQFILQRSAADQQTPKNESREMQQDSKEKPLLGNSPLTLPTSSGERSIPMASSSSSDKMGETSIKKKIFGLIGDNIKVAENVGIVKGIPQMKAPKNQPQYPDDQRTTFSAGAKTPLHNDEISSNKYNSNEFNSADIRNSLDTKTNHFQQSEPRDDNISEVLNNNDLPQISANGALVPPPYRDPPPPRNSPLQQNQKLENFNNAVGCSVRNTNFHTANDYQDGINMTTYYSANDIAAELNDNFFQNVQYKDLIQLIKFQREKINSQKNDMTKFDSEIVYLENKELDNVDQLDVLAVEINKADEILRQGSEQLQTLQYVEEENELVRQQEKTLKSEITLLRSKLANCETELLQCKNKIRLLMDDIAIEQRALNSRQKDSRQQMERSFMSEVDRIQSEIDHAITSSETSNKTMENLKKEVNLIENAIAEKKRQVEQLVNEMKEVNLQSLAVAPSDEIRHLLESCNKPGSSRRIIGSPRQLENAVPTSKNPHGVWV